MKATANAVAFFCVQRRSTMPHFDELHTIEQMTIDTLQQNGWMYIKAADLPRTYDSVLVEPMLRDALVRLNPCIAEEPSRAAITWLDGAKDMDDYEHARPRRPPEARSHLAFPRLGQIALDGVRRAEAAHDGGPPESDRRHH